MNHTLILILALTLGCGDNGGGVPPPDVLAIDAPPDAEPPCIVLGCPVPTCSGDPAVCTCNGATCVPTGIPAPQRCDELACVSLACGTGTEAGVCQCELSTGVYATCLTE